MIAALFEFLVGFLIQDYIFLVKIIWAGLKSIPLFVYIGIVIFFILKYNNQQNFIRLINKKLNLISCLFSYFIFSFLFL